MVQIRSFLIGLLLPSILYAGGSPTDAELISKCKKLVGLLRNKIGAVAFAQIQEEALLKLANGDFEAFDPLVGDTACQLRSLVCTVVGDPTLLSATLKDWITLVYILGQALITPRGIDGFNIHNQQGINSVDALNVFLARFKSKLAKTMLSELKRAVAYGSVVFARMQADLLPSSCCADVCELFDDQCLIDCGRPTVPCTAICYLMLERARVLRTPLVFRLRLAENTIAPSLGTVTAAYVADAQGVFHLVNPRSLLGNPRVIVIEGLWPRFTRGGEAPTPEQLEQLLETIDFEAQTLLDHQLHPQYAGEQRDTGLANAVGNLITREWLEVRQTFTDEVLARDRYGRITANDPREFIIDHIYAGTLEQAARYNPFNAQAQARAVDLRNAVYFPNAPLLGINRLQAAAMAFSAALLTFATRSSR